MVSHFIKYGKHLYELDGSYQPLVSTTGPNLSPPPKKKVFRRGGGFVQEFRLENRSYPDVHDFSLRMQVIIANANNIADSHGGGGGVSEHPKKKPVSAPAYRT